MQTTRNDIVILLTGFEPFDGEKFNSSWEVAKTFENEQIAGAKIIVRQLPVSFQKVSSVLSESIAEICPDVILLLGQGGGRFEVGVERVALNLDDSSKKDNAGYQPIDEIIHEDGDTAYFSNLPIKAIRDAIKNACVPAVISNTAGTFVCNHTLYEVLYQIDKRHPEIKAGFMHLPHLPVQVLDKPKKPSMGLAEMKTAVMMAIKAIVHDEMGKITNNN